MRSVFPVLAMAALHGTVAAQSRPDSVALSFGWPVGLEAAITHHRLQVTSDGGARPESSAVVVTYGMRVQADPRGRLIEYRDFRFPGLPDSLGAQLPAGWVEQIASAGAPSVIVDDAGAFVSLADPERFAATIRGMLQPTLDSLPPARAGLRDFVERLLDPAVIGAQAAGDWYALVGWWAGARLERGRAVTETVDQAMPMLPGRTVPYHTRRTFVSRQPCTESAGDSSCVALELISTPDSAAVRALIADVMKDLIRDGPPSTAVLRRLESEFRIRVIAEPRGLIPHELDIVQSVAVEAESPAEGVSRQSMDRYRVLRYSYAQP